MSNRKPTAVLEAKGAFKKDPQRRRDGEPEVNTPLGPPPGHLSPDEHKAWNELAGLAPDNVLTSADRVSVEAAARLLVEMRADFAAMQTTRINMFSKLLGQFGMNPVDRSRLSVAKPKDANPFDQLG